jgi:monooxygenase
MSPSDHVDVLIIGAGLSGIGAARHLLDRCPGKTYAILESRDAIGGTWDLFRYPGIRSDSDMFTLGYRFKPWTDGKALADGPAIREYVNATAAERGIEQHIRFNHRVTRIEWSTPDAQWTVVAERTDTGETVTMTASFVFSCSGYYRYDEGYTPEFPGVERFAGPVVHPQHWPEDLDYAGKRVVVIGSGATAVTLVPAMAESGAEHVTMLQRSPSYVVTIPNKDYIALGLQKVLPAKAAYMIVRWKNVLLQTLFFRASKRWPDRMKKLIRKGAMRHLPASFAVDTHFNPTYNPWDQRLCVVPDGDLFNALSSGKADVVTDQIETFTEKGLKLASGAELEADIIVTATGLNLLPLGGLDFVIDGREVPVSSTMAYKSIMLSDVPNYAYAVGYTNASWTLKADLAAEYVCRVLNHMDANGYAIATPQRDPSVREGSFFTDFQPGYVKRSLDKFPKSGDRAPWQVYMNYPKDLVTLRHGPIDDDMRFEPAPVRQPEKLAA